MIKIEDTDVYGWEVAIRGARNPMNSWDKSDSEFGCRDCSGCYYQKSSVWGEDDNGNDVYYCSHVGLKLGGQDHKLLQSLANAGPDHGKFLRFISVSLDITAPLYWWKEFDTYKVGTVANSCSTMHKIHAKEFELSDFSTEHLIVDGEACLQSLIQYLNYCRENFLETKDKSWWWQMIQLLPTSYNQRRTVMLNYQVLKTMYHARKHHKLDEWRAFCEWVRTLPYSELITSESGE